MAAKKKAAKAVKAAAPEEHVGTVEHYYPKVKAAAVKLDADLKLGDTIHIQGATDDYTEKVTSMQLDHAPIQEGHAGQSIGVRVPVKVHEHSEVTKVPPGGAAKSAKAPKAPKAPKKAAKKPAKKAPKRGKAKKAKKAGKARKAGKAGKAKKAKRGRKVPRRAGKSAASRRRAGKRPTRGR